MLQSTYPSRWSHGNILRSYFVKHTQVWSVRNFNQTHRNCVWNLQKEHRRIIKLHLGLASQLTMRNACILRSYARILTRDKKDSQTVFLETDSNSRLHKLHLKSFEIVAFEIPEGNNAILERLHWTGANSLCAVCAYHAYTRGYLPAIRKQASQI